MHGKRRLLYVYLCIYIYIYTYVIMSARRGGGGRRSRSVVGGVIQGRCSSIGDERVGQERNVLPPRDFDTRLIIKRAHQLLIYTHTHTPRRIVYILQYNMYMYICKHREIRTQSLPADAADCTPPSTLHIRTQARTHYIPLYNMYVRINIMCTKRIIIYMHIYIYVHIYVICTYKYIHRHRLPASHRSQPVKFVSPKRTHFFRPSPLLHPYPTPPPRRHASPFQNIFCVGWHEGV